MKLKNIKDSFENREIKPSNGSWDVLAGRLDAQEKQQSKKPVVVYWLAAIAAVLIAAVLIYPALKSNTQIVDRDKNQIVITKETKAKENAIKKPNTLKTEHLKETFKTEVQIVTNESNAVPVLNNNDQKAPVKTKQADLIAQKTNALMAENQLVKESIEYLNAPVKEPILEQQENTSITITEENLMARKALTVDEEMELLLNEALQKVQVTEIAVTTVNPEQLLRETEWDIESDKRSRLQKGIKNGWNVLKNEAFAIVEIKK